ncbi:hypothetical protein [Bosea sp. NBC_00550]|uniref:hypothetical protein n=1 Tax=Bosea sp. NBC_00550 TaxID=2969621 RepID=UPI00222E6344|nr:hypothetical protein [Bosea sp. NBC_00550]UZF93012.1 hypothetical protein NWE53_02000 [Bosea sp. NBC_00550]
MHYPTIDAVVIRPLAELIGPAIRLDELVEDEGPERVIRAIDLGLVFYDGGGALLVQRQVFDLLADGYGLKQQQPQHAEVA